MKPLYQRWVEDVIRWAHSAEGTVEHAAELIYRELRGGVTPPPPDQTGTPLGGLAA